MISKPKIKIFVAHHKPGYIYEDDVYIPIQVGKKNSKIDLGILGDDTGDNISEKNDNYAELTAQYWVWKNYDLRDVDYVGFCHYRRYMSYTYKINYNDIEYCIKKSVKNKDSFHRVCGIIINTVTGYSIDKKFSADIIQNSGIVDYIQRSKSNVFLSNTNFTFSSSLKQLQINKFEIRNEVKDIIILKYPGYKNYMNRKLRYIRNINYCNIFVMRKDLFIEYEKWLFDIIFLLENRLKSKGLESLSLQCNMAAGGRFYGCLAERLLNLWVLYEKSNKKVKVSKDAKLIFFDNL